MDGSGQAEIGGKRQESPTGAPPWEWDLLFTITLAGAPATVLLSAFRPTSGLPIPDDTLLPPSLSPHPSGSVLLRSAVWHNYVYLSALCLSGLCVSNGRLHLQLAEAVNGTSWFP